MSDLTKRAEAELANITPLSFSRLSTFESCEQKFDYLYISKSVKDSDNEYTIYGTRVHEALEKYGREGTEPPAESAPFKSLVDKIVAVPGTHYFEHQMSVDRNSVPCGWFDPLVWIRGIADVLVIEGTRAFCLDWKTGKPKDNPTQLQLFAALIFIHFPEVQEVRTSFIWLNHGQTTDMRFTRAMFPHIWSALTTRFKRVQETIDAGVYKARPSGLCRFCPARSICVSAR